MTALTEQDRRKYRSLLNDLAGRVAAEAKELAVEGTAPEDRAAMAIDAVPEQMDRAAREAEEEVARAVLSSEGHILGEARAALARLDAGTFGRCERCGRPVGKKRLDAVPYARHCMSCEAAPANGEGRGH